MLLTTWTLISSSGSSAFISIDTANSSTDIYGLWNYNDTAVNTLVSSSDVISKHQKGALNSVASNVGSSKEKPLAVTSK